LNICILFNFSLYLLKLLNKTSMPEYYIQDISENLTDSQYSSLCSMYQDYLIKQLMEEINQE
jgi:hypothetical protein